MGFKAIKTIFWFRFFAVLDVLFSEEFELETWDKNGNRKSKTAFSRTEIKEKL